MTEEAPEVSGEKPSSPVGAASAAPTAARRSRVTIVLAVLLVAALTATALLWYQNRSLSEDQRLAEAAADATAVAEEVVTRMTTYNYTTVDEDFSWVTEVGTAKFEREQEATSTPLIPIIKRTQAQATGTVQRSAATAKDEDEVVVLLFVDQVLGRAGTEQTNVDRTRVEMTMVRGGDGWLVDEIQLY